jgi:hypothetical protein
MLLTTGSPGKAMLIGTYEPVWVPLPNLPMGFVPNSGCARWGDCTSVEPVGTGYAGRPKNLGISTNIGELITLLMPSTPLELSPMA